MNPTRIAALFVVAARLDATSGPSYRDRPCPTPLLFVTQVAPYRTGRRACTACSTRPRSGSRRSRRCTGCARDASTTCATLDDDDLAAARVLALFTIGETPWSATAARDRRSSVCAPARSRSCAIHSATDSCYGWDEYGGVVGARFDGHPWTQTVDARRARTRRIPRPRTSAPTWSWHDEVYQFRDLRPDARVLLRVREGAARSRRAGREAAAARLPALVVLHRGRGPRVLDEPRALPRRVGESDVPAAPHRRPRVGARRGRVAPVLDAPPPPPAPEPVRPQRRRNFSPWAYWQLQLAETAPPEPCPVDDLARGFDGYRERARDRLDGAARRMAGAGAARPRGARARRRAARTRATASCSTAKRRCRCPRTCSCRTSAPSPGPAVLAIHGHGAGKSMVCGLDRGDEELRAEIDGYHGDYAHQLACRGYVVLAPDLRGFGERADWNPPERYQCDWNLVSATIAGANPLTQNLWDLRCALDVLARAPARRRRAHRRRRLLLRRHGARSSSPRSTSG